MECLIYSQVLSEGSLSLSNRKRDSVHVPTAYSTDSSLHGTAPPLTHQKPTFHLSKSPNKAKNSQTPPQKKKFTTGKFV